jgi:hypothetical protein
MAKLFFFSYPNKERNGDEEKEHLIVSLEVLHTIE